MVRSMVRSILRSSRFFVPVAVKAAAVASVATAALLLVGARHAAAGQPAIAANLTATTTATAYFGQSITNASGSSYNNLIFNFYSNTAATTSTAVGTYLTLRRHGKFFAFYGFAITGLRGASER